LHTKRRLSNPVQISVSAVFTALVAASTIVISIYVPATRGYFNVGETMIYITAFLFGPFVGAFAGGVGSMLSDIFLGYGQFAFGTLVIKACEGAIVGFLSRKAFGSESKSTWKAFTIALGLVVGITLATVGSIYYTGQVELRIGIPPPENPSLTLSIIPEFWYGLGMIVAVLVSLTGFILEPFFGWMLISVLIGGLEMVFGYFLYEFFVLGFGFAAAAEVPVNIGQMSVGLIVAIPVVRVVWRYLPDLRKII